MINKRQWDVAIGLEVHAQLKTESKLFSSAPTVFGQPPNTQVNLFDIAYPGTLPVINVFAIKQAIKSCLCLKTKINLVSAFDRKLYFYADQPHNYQITQWYHTLANDGHLEVSDKKKIRIRSVHLENDAGKMIRDISPSKDFIDLNRSGCALIEIVTHPDFTCKEEVIEFIGLLRKILLYAGTCDGNMEEGSLRADVSVSLNLPGEPLGVRREIKNLNSFRHIALAIDSEVKQQTKLLENKKPVKQATCGFNVSTGKTYVMREKEDASDYCYHPEPDLPPLILTQEEIDHEAKLLPELPDAKYIKFIDAYKLDKHQAEVLTSHPNISSLFENTVTTIGKKGLEKAVANIILSHVFCVMRENQIELQQIAPDHVAYLAKKTNDKTINSNMVKDILRSAIKENVHPREIVAKQNLEIVADENQLKHMVREILINNPNNVKKYKDGKTSLMTWFVGQVMRQTKGNASADLSKKIIEEEINKIKQ